MADNLIRITDAMLEGKGVLPLDDIPGLSADAMKAKIEEIIRTVVIPAFNDNMNEIADYIYYDPGTGTAYITVNSLIDSYARIQSATQTDADKVANVLAVKEMDTYLKSQITPLTTKVGALETTVGGNNSGLVKQVNDLDGEINGEVGIANMVSVLNSRGFITFDKNDGSGVHINQIVAIDYENNSLKVPLTAPSFTRTGYTFLGWSMDESSVAADYQNGDTVSNLDRKIYGNCLTLYAVWEEDAP